MNSAWTLDIDAKGLAWLTFDAPGTSVNTFSRATLMGLDERLDEVGSAEDVRALVITSAKRDSFIVGADIGELERLEDYDHVLEVARTGQGIFSKLASLDVPTIAVIHGACMGGGLEMALSCDYRMVSEHPKTLLGLPEVNLGILPGWGGTQRLPRLIGLAPALTLILTGKAVNGRKAGRLGLADGFFTPAFIRAQVISFIDQIGTEEGQRKIHEKRRAATPKVMRWLASTPLTRWIIFRSAQKNVLSKTKGHYPAPLEALEVVQRTYGGTLERGLEVEAGALASLATSPISRNLIWLFQMSQRFKRGDGSNVAPVRGAGVLGAGVMGGGIAWALANAGVRVRMKDIGWDALALGMRSASGMFDAQIKRRKLTEGKKAQAMLRIAPTLGYQSFDVLDCVVEAVVENMDVKKSVLRELEQHVSNDCLICTNTSSLPIEEMAEALEHPERFVGLHFFNPVNRMQLVEVIPCSKTSPDAIARAMALVRQIGKMPLVVGACPGFLVNRILLPYMVEATRMVEEGVSPERIDQALESFGMPMGPLTLADEVGLDVGYKVAKVLEDEYGSRMSVPEGFGRIVESGEFKGRKSGAGIYVWNGTKKCVNVKAVRAAINGHETQAEALRDEDIVDRTVLAMVNEAARCLEEGVAQSPGDLDAAMVMGTGFAPFTGGVMRYAESRGLPEVVERLRALEATWGERFSVAPLLERAACEGASLSALCGSAKGDAS